MLLLAGLSCKYNVTLPWVPGDANVQASEDTSPRVPEDTGVRIPDSAIDLTPPTPDLPIAPPDTRACSGNKYQAWPMVSVQVIVAIDRSTNMQSVQRDFEPSKTQAVWSGLNYAKYPGIAFSTIWFPWNKCAGQTCCATEAFDWRPMGTPDAAGTCGPYDMACGPSSNESPSNQALERASNAINNNWRWNYEATVILITDQKPSCAGDSPSDNSACESAVNQAIKLGERGIRTYVVVPTADPRTPDCLARIARQNNRDGDPQQFVVANSSKDLQKKLEAIIRESQKKMCFFVAKEAAPGQIQEVKIGNNPPIRSDDSGATGWRTSGSAIELSPDECERALSLSPPTITVTACNGGGGPGPGPYGN